MRPAPIPKDTPSLPKPRAATRLEDNVVPAALRRLRMQHDLIHDLSRRRLMLQQYDQYIAHANENTDLQAFWKRQREQEAHAILELKQLIDECAGPESP